MESRLQQSTQNIMTISNLQEKLGAKKFDINTREDVYRAIQLYARQITKNASLKLKLVLPFKIIGQLNTFSIYKESTFEWLSNTEKNKLAIRDNLGLSSEINNSIIDLIGNTLDVELNQSEIVTQLQTKLMGYTDEDINSVLNGIINNPQYAILGKSKYLSSKFYPSSHTIFSKLADLISEMQNVNVMFVMLTSITKIKEITRLNPIILSKMNPSRSTLAININLHGIHSIQKSSHSLDRIVFEYIHEIDYADDTVNKLLGRDITENIIKQHSSELQRALSNTSLESNNEIAFEPFDKEIDLKVVKIDVGGKTRSFLLGSTLNLYEDDDVKNDLVGKIKNWDMSNFNAEIYWCNSYLEKIKDN